MKTIGIVGTRRKDSEEYFEIVKEEFLRHYVEGDIICSGLCPRGADWFAVLLSLNLSYIGQGPKRSEILYQMASLNVTYSIQPLWFPADWGKYGKAAGFLRNTDIASNSDRLIALVADDRTGGTEDTVKKFAKMHGETHLHILL